MYRGLTGDSLPSSTKLHQIETSQSESTCIHDFESVFSCVQHLDNSGAVCLSLSQHLQTSYTSSLGLLVVKSCHHHGHMCQCVPCRINKPWGSGRRLLLGEDNGDGVIEDALTKHQHVEDRVHVEGIKDGDGSYRVHSGDQWAKGKATAWGWKWMEDNAIKTLL